MWALVADAGGRGGHIGCARGAGRSVAHEFELIDHFDAEMARTTGFSAACVARRIASGVIEGCGVRFPEEIFLGEQFESIVGELGAKGVRVEHREREITTG